MRMILFSIALALCVLSGKPSYALLKATSSGAGAISAITGNGTGGTLANILGTYSLLDNDPIFQARNGLCPGGGVVCQTDSLQKALIAAREMAFTLKGTYNASIMLRSCVEFYFPILGAQVTTTVTVPPLVCFRSDGIIRRSGTTGTAGTNCSGAFDSNTLKNLECPAIVFAPGSHNLGHLDVYASTTGAGGDGGSGVYIGKAQLPTAEAIAPGAAGSGYTSGLARTIAIVTAFSASPTSINKTIGVNSTTNVAVGQHITDATTPGAILANTVVSSFIPDASSHSFSASTAVSAGQAHVNFTSGGTACSQNEIITDTTNAVIPAGTTITSVNPTSLGLSLNITGGGIVSGDTIICYPTIVLSAAVGSGGTILNDTLNLNDVVTLPQPDASPYSAPQIEVTGVNGSGVITSASFFNTPSGCTASPNHCGSYSTDINLQEYEYTALNGWTGTLGTVATPSAKGNVFDPSIPGNYMTSGGTGTGAEFTLTYQPDFAGGGADYSGGAYLGANTMFGQVSVQSAGNWSDATYGSSFGVGFNGLQFVGDTIQVTGGHYGIWPGGSDDFFFTEMNPVDSDIGMKFGPGGGGFRGHVTVDSPTQAYIVGDVYEDVNITGAFLQKSPALYTGSYDIILGEGSSSGSSALNAGWKLNILMEGTGATGGIPAMQIANTIGSSFDFNINNFGKNGVAITNGIISSYAALGANATNNTYLGSINDAASTLFTGTLDSGSTIRVWDATLGAWDLAPGYVQNVGCGGTGWSNTGIGTAEVNNLSVAYPKLNANDAIRVSSLWSRSGTGADSASETIRLCSGACSCVSGATCTSGSIIGSHPSTTITTSATASIPIWLVNQNATNAQVMFPQTSAGNITSSGAVTTNAIQTNTGGFVNFDSTTITSSADTDKLQSYCVEVLRNPF